MLYVGELVIWLRKIKKAGDGSRDFSAPDHSWDPSATSEVLGVKLTSPRAGAMPYLASLPTLGLQRGQQLSQCPMCCSTAASHDIVGERMLPAWRQPQLPSRTGCLQGSGWRVREGLGSGIKSRLDRCNAISRPLLQGRKKRSGRDMWALLPGYTSGLCSCTIPKWFPHLLGLPWWWGCSSSKIVCTKQGATKIQGEFQQNNMLFGGFLWMFALGQSDFSMLCLPFIIKCFVCFFFFLISSIC